MLQLLTLYFCVKFIASFTGSMEQKSFSSYQSYAHKSPLLENSRLKRLYVLWENAIWKTMSKTETYNSIKNSLMFIGLTVAH